MRKSIYTCIILFVAPFQTLYALENNNPTFDDKVNAVLSNHYSAYSEKEYFSGISLSIYTPGQTIKDYYIGHVAHEANSKNITSSTLFQIGSITKSFTAAITLQLAKENKLHLQDTLAQWLPQYPKWSTLTVKTLLNMTSGLPNYSDAPLMNADVYQQPEHQFSTAEIINFVYPPDVFAPPLKSGYFYTNTGYVLTDMIIEKITKHSIRAEMENRLFKVAKLSNTFYPVPTLDPQTTGRIAHGYGYNSYIDPELVGKETQGINLSWAGAAGAIISTSEDVVKWVQALFVDYKILDANQKKDLMALVSTATGEPVSKTSLKDPHAFGLGVIQGFDKDIGTYWFYEGQTQGFRALYMYVPSNGIIICGIFNSSVNGENDHASELIKKAYQLAKKKM